MGFPPHLGVTWVISPTQVWEKAHFCGRAILLRFAIVISQIGTHSVAISYSQTREFRLAGTTVRVLHMQGLLYGSESLKSDEF
jgi:hypothetical protein